MTTKMRIEQTPTTEYRNEYDPTTDSFAATKYKSLLYIRGIHGYYGWITDTGTPPSSHLDIILISDETHEVGDVVECRIIGFYKRNDLDHKILGISLDSAVNDIAELPRETYERLEQIYGKEYEGEAWMGREDGERIYSEYQKRHS